MCRRLSLLAAPHFVLVWVQGAEAAVLVVELGQFEVELLKTPHVDSSRGLHAPRSGPLQRDVDKRGRLDSMGDRYPSSLAVEREGCPCWSSTVSWTCRSPVAEEGRQAKIGVALGEKAVLSNRRRRGGEVRRREAESPAERGRVEPGSPRSEVVR